MPSRDDLERQAAELARQLTAELVESSEQLDYQMGTFLLMALAAELGQRAQDRCWQQARLSTGTWELAAAEAETMINAAWRCMETISVIANQFRD